MAARAPAPPVPRLARAEPDHWLARPDWPPPELAGAPVSAFSQAWRPQSEPGLRPGRVWLAATARSFVALAELVDEDLFTTARRRNDPLWDLGDVFEIFVRHTGRPEYFEFHTAPNGLTLDLRYPRPYAPRTNGVDAYLLAEPHFTAAVRAEPARVQWRIVAEIPIRGLLPPGLAADPSEWQFSFSRYDCGPGRAPIYSSTSPHRELDFHRVEDWPVFAVPGFDLT